MIDDLFAVSAARQPQSPSGSAANPTRTLAPLGAPGAAQLMLRFADNLA